MYAFIRSLLFLLFNIVPITAKPCNAFPTMIFMYHFTCSSSAALCRSQFIPFHSAPSVLRFQQHNLLRKYVFYALSRITKRYMTFTYGCLLLLLPWLYIKGRQHFTQDAAVFFKKITKPHSMSQISVSNLFFRSPLLPVTLLTSWLLQVIFFSFSFFFYHFIYLFLLLFSTATRDTCWNSAYILNLIYTNFFFEYKIKN